MTNTVELKVISPEKLVKSLPVEMVVVPGLEGDMGVLPGHSPLIAEVRPGVLDIRESGKIVEQIFVSGGFCEISPEHCTVLAEEAIPISEIDKAAAEDSLNSAKKSENKHEQLVAEALIAAVS